MPTLGAVFVLALGACGSSTAPRDKHLRSAPTLDFATDFRPEAGPDGQEWRWVGESAGVTLRGRGSFWLAFRARSLRRKRTVYFGARNGMRLGVDVSPRPAVHIVGPFKVRRMLDLGLQPEPGPARASSVDPRYVSIFVSNMRVLTQPIAALPTVGFYRTEFDSAQRPFNWLNARGTLDVASTDPRASRFWLRFHAQSIDAARELEFRVGAVKRSTTISAANGSTVAAGPFPMSEGAAHVRVRALQPARRYGSDPRLLSVRFSDLAALTTAPTKP